MGSLATSDKHCSNLTLECDIKDQNENAEVSCEWSLRSLKASGRKAEIPQ